MIAQSSACSSMGAGCCGGGDDDATPAVGFPRKRQRTVAQRASLRDYGPSRPWPQPKSWLQAAPKRAAFGYGRSLLGALALRNLSRSATVCETTGPMDPRIVEKVARFPTGPGIYLFTDAAGETLYVGKAAD